MALVIGLVAVAALAFAPAPYVIEQPGPVLNVLGDVTVDGAQSSLITIGDSSDPALTPHDVDGQLDMLTVTRVGDPSNLPGWIEVVQAWFDPTKVLVPVEQVFPPGTDSQQQSSAEAAQMTSSQDDAVAAALTQMGVSFGTTIVVSSVGEGQPASGWIEKGDVIRTVEGSAVESMDDVARLVRSTPSGQDVVFGIERNGQAQQVSVTPKLALASDGNEYPFVGISGTVKYTFPVDVQYAVQNIGGPSAGMVFSLALIDKLGSTSLLDGTPIAGTGTIDADGDVGAIGGVRQKAFGAAAAGAKAMIIPASNCGELGGGLPSQMPIYPVSTLKDALGVPSALRGDASAPPLPSCPLGQDSGTAG